MKLKAVALLLFYLSSINGFSAPVCEHTVLCDDIRQSATVFSAHMRKLSKSPRPLIAALSATAADVPFDGNESTSDVSDNSAKRSIERNKKRWQLIRAEGGIFALNTKYGAFNPYGFYYGLTSIVLGVFWYLALTACQGLYMITGNRIDKLVSLKCSFWSTRYCFVIESHESHYARSNESQTNRIFHTKHRD